MATRKKYLGVESGIGDMSYDPFAGDQEAQTVEEGPTPENPFRYTEHSRNPQGSLAAGRNVQGISGRSMTGGRSFDDMMPDLYQDQLPMKDVTVATGDLSQYEGEVQDPYSVQGRQEIAEMGSYTGATESTQVFDMDMIGESMGLTPEQIGNITRPEHETYYTPKATEAQMGRDAEPRDFNWQSADDWRDEIAENQPTMPAKPVGRDGDVDPYPTEFNPDQYDTRQYVDPSTYEDLGISEDERDFFVGLSMMSDSGDLNLNLNRVKHLDYVRKLGKSSTSRSNLTTGAGHQGRYDALMNEDTFSKQQDRIHSSISKSTQSPEKWKAIASTGLMMVVIGGLTYGIGAAAAPAIYAATSSATASAIGSGAIAGASGSVMQQKFTNPNAPIDWGQVGTGAAIGGATGGVANYLRGGTAAAQGGAVAPAASTMSGKDAAMMISSAGVGGGIQGYQKTQQYDAAIADADRRTKLANIEKVSQLQTDISAQRQEFNNMFGIGEDDPYMQYNRDLNTTQQEIV